jgi:hypothetical protein
MSMRRWIEVAVPLLMTVLAIAGPIDGERSHASTLDVASQVSSPAGRSSNGLVETESPASTVAILPTRVEIALRRGSSPLLLELNADPGLAPHSRHGGFADRALLIQHESGPVRRPPVDAGRLARSGAISSFGTSLPPPYIA